MRDKKNLASYEPTKKLLSNFILYMLKFDSNFINRKRKPLRTKVFFYSDNIH